MKFNVHSFRSGWVDEIWDCFFFDIGIWRRTVTAPNVSLCSSFDDYDLFYHFQRIHVYIYVEKKRKDERIQAFSSDANKCKVHLFRMTNSFRKFSHFISKDRAREAEQNDLFTCFFFNRLNANYKWNTVHDCSISDLKICQNFSFQMTVIQRVTRAPDWFSHMLCSLFSYTKRLKNV